MLSFSQRMGLKPIKSIIQKDSADEELRNALWNLLSTHYFLAIHDWIPHAYQNEIIFLEDIWTKYYKLRIDELDSNKLALIRKLKNDFINGSWYEMYDILQFIPNNYEEEYDNTAPYNQTNNNFIAAANECLSENLSAYRFVDFQIVEITSEEEISTIEKALQIDSTYKPVQIHLKRSLELLADRKNPDYRNSIKESISAIESLSCIITKNPKATLGAALKEMEKKQILHAAFKSALSSMYGYTSDESGIRHSLLDEPNINQTDAKFMLVICSAFTNYLIEKIS